ncbi:hypothetical protein Bca4012_058707 [Brassica carinata]
MVLFDETVPDKSRGVILIFKGIIESIPEIIIGLLGQGIVAAKLLLHSQSKAIQIVMVSNFTCTVAERAAFSLRLTATHEGISGTLTVCQDVGSVSEAMDKMIWSKDKNITTQRQNYKFGQAAGSESCHLGKSARLARKQMRDSKRIYLDRVTITLIHLHV